MCGTVGNMPEDSESANMGARPAADRLQAWATVGATVFTGLAVLVSSISLAYQVSALRLEVAAREEAKAEAQHQAVEARVRESRVYASKVRWWRSGELVVQNGSDFAILNGFFTTNVYDPSGFPVVVWIGTLEPCSLLRADWADPELQDIAIRGSLSRLWFTDAFGGWWLDETQTLGSTNRISDELLPPLVYRHPRWNKEHIDYCL